jgi:signal transduction histidine kinase
VFAALQHNPQTAQIPVIFVTAQNDIQSELKALSVGAVDFISKPIVPEIVRARVYTHLTLRQQALALQQLNTTLESKVQERTQQVQALNAALEERASQAETANHAKALFLGNMSHELRTPMSAILGFSDLLLQTTKEPSSVQKLSNICKAAKHLSMTIEEILDFSQLEEGKMGEVATDFDLADLIHHVDKLIEEHASVKNLHYSSRIDPLIPSPLLGDSVKLEQILTNLAGNAIKFTREGTVTVDARLITSAADAVELELTVEDTGIGIEASKLVQIFDPFNQADSGLTRQYGGVGLGLSINRKLIEMMGGEMGVDSVVGKGSRFWVKLRLKRSQLSSRRNPV